MFLLPTANAIYISWGTWAVIKKYSLNNPTRKVSYHVCCAGAIMSLVGEA